MGSIDSINMLRHAETCNLDWLGQSSLITAEIFGASVYLGMSWVACLAR